MSEHDPSLAWQPITASRDGLSLLAGLVRLPICLIVFVVFTTSALALLWGGCDPAWIRCRWLRFGARVELAVLGVTVEVQGADGLDTSGPLLLLSNHGSLLDVLLFGALLRRPARCVLRQAFAGIPLLGPVLRRAGHILIDRDSARSASRGLETAAQALGRGEPVLLFPEGRRSSHGTLAPLRVGAFRLAIRTGAPVIPITVLNAASLLPTGSRIVRPGVLRVVVGDPIDTRGWSQATLEAHLRQVRDAIAAPLAAYRSELKT